MLLLMWYAKFTKLCAKHTKDAFIYAIWELKKKKENKISNKNKREIIQLKQ